MIENYYEKYLSGTYIVKFPRNGYLLTFDLINETDIIISQKQFSTVGTQQVPTLGLLHTVTELIFNRSILTLIKI